MARRALFYVSKVSSSSLARTPKLLWRRRSRLKLKPSSKTETRLFASTCYFFPLFRSFARRLTSLLCAARAAIGRRIQSGAPRPARLEARDLKTRDSRPDLSQSVPDPTRVDRSQHSQSPSQSQSQSPRPRVIARVRGTGGSDNDNDDIVDRLKCLEVGS